MEAILYRWDLDKGFTQTDKIPPALSSWRTRFYLPEGSWRAVLFFFPNDGRPIPKEKSEAYARAEYMVVFRDPW